MFDGWSTFTGMSMALPFLWCLVLTFVLWHVTFLFDDDRYICLPADDNFFGTPPDCHVEVSAQFFTTEFNKITDLDITRLESFGIPGFGSSALTTIIAFWIMSFTRSEDSPTDWSPAVNDQGRIGWQRLDYNVISKWS
jgi:hypothetical protein